MTAGDYGVAVAGAYGKATAGAHGVAIVGTKGRAVAGDYGLARTGALGTADVGDGGTAIGSRNSTVRTGDWGFAYIDQDGTAIVGLHAKAFVGIRSAAAGDEGSILHFEWWKEEFRQKPQRKTVIAYVGKGRIRPGVLYRVNDEGKVARADERGS